jgi:AcrR family transcriptional regulator
MVNMHKPREESAATVESGRRERKRSATRDRLFRCAMHLFAERGFFNTTVEDITRAADVGKGTFFNYFPSKDHIIGVFAEIQLSKANAAFAEASAGTESVREVLHRLFSRIAEEPSRSRALARSLLTALVGSSAVRTIVTEAMAHGRELLANTFRLGQARKEVRAELDPTVLALHFQQCVIGTLAVWAMQDKGKIQPHIEISFSTFWTGVAAKKD